MPPARAWRDYPQRYRLEAGRCKKCSKVFFPPRQICDKCGNRDFETFRLAPHGKIATYTVIRTPSKEFSDQAPFALGIIEMEEGVRLMAQIAEVDFEELSVGMPVRLEFRRLYEEGCEGLINYGHKAVPIRA